VMNPCENCCHDESYYKREKVIKTLLVIHQVSSSDGFHMIICHVNV
jgi:hypothetical protein